MAATSIWSVKGWLGKVVIYAENPEKTTNPDFVEWQGIPEEGVQGLSDVIAYAVSEEKTRQRKAGKEEEESRGQAQMAEAGIVDEEMPMSQYVSGVNCSPAIARMEMLAVKKRFGKEEGIVAYHGYQSFAPGECTPAMAHRIGVMLAEELWGNRFQVLVATHLDKANHLHNHFVVNSVSFLDGLKYHRTKQDYREMREASDRLCREHGLSVIEKENPGRGKGYGEWRAQQEGKPTYRGLVREDVEDAILKARTEKQFFRLMREKGYSIKTGKDITVRPEGRERGLKLARNFGEEYTIEAIRRRILQQPGMGTEKGSKAPELSGSIPIPSRKGAEASGCKLPASGRKVYDVRDYGSRRRVRKLKGLRGMYFRYCYLLGILPKNGKGKTPGQVHHMFREDLIKLNTIAKESRLLCHYRIDTAEQLSALQEDLKARMEMLSDKRKALRSKSRSIREEGGISEARAEIRGLTEQIKEIRKEVNLCEGIAGRSGGIKERMERKETMQKIKRREKEESRREHIRGCR